MSESFIEKEIHEKQKHHTSPLNHKTESPKKENSDRPQSSLNDKINSKAESKIRSISTKIKEIKIADTPNKDKSQQKIATDVKSSMTPTHSPRKTRSRSRTANINPNVTENSKVETPKGTSRARLRLKLPQLDGANDVKKATNKRTKSNAITVKAEESNSDSDFAPSPPKRSRPKVDLNKSAAKSKAIASRRSRSTTKRNTSIDRRILSSDDEEQDSIEDSAANNTNNMNFWVEAYAEKEKKWIAIDPVKKKVDAIDFIRVCIKKH